MALSRENCELKENACTVGYDVWETSTEIPYSNFPRGMTNQRLNPDLGSDASSVWNFCSRFSDVIWPGNQWWRCKMSAVFSG